MLEAKVYQKLTEEASEAVMVRVVLEHALETEAVDADFEESRDDQYTRTLLFSASVGLMVCVVCRIRRSVNSAYKLHQNRLGVSLKSVYNKLNASDPSVCPGLVSHASQRMAQVMKELKTNRPPLVPGYRTRILDGNQFAATEHRLKELRTISSGPLPGKALVVWDPDMGMIRDVYCSEDSYQQERQMVLDVLETIQEGELWMADRNFCTAAFVWQVHCSKACFVVRRHAQNVRMRPAGPERKIGSTATGMVHETPVHVEDNFGNYFPARLIRVDLETLARDGANSIEILTNLPADVAASTIAETYRERWQIETVFFELDRVFEGEIKTLAHPGAAILAFCISLIAYNALCLVRRALAATHGEEAAARVSDYYFTELVSSDWRALDIFADPEDWKNRFGQASARTVAHELMRLAKKVDMARLKKLLEVRRNRSPNGSQQSGGRTYQRTGKFRQANRKDRYDFRTFKGLIDPTTP